MKKLSLIFLSICILASFSLHAQKKFTGVIQFKTKIEGTDDPNLVSSIESMTTVASILGNKSKTVQVLQDGMVSVTSIWDGDKGTAMNIIEITGMGKFYKKTTAEEHQENLKLSETKVNYVDEYKTILDYKCQKVEITVTDLEDDSTKELILYVTKEIGGPKINGEQYPGLEGLALLTLMPLPQYCDECMMAVEAVKITAKKIKDVDFMLPADAKNIDEEPEMKEMLGW